MEDKYKKLIEEIAERSISKMKEGDLKEKAKALTFEKKFELALYLAEEMSKTKSVNY